MTHADAAAVESSENTYDELPYPGAPFAQTHPIRMATIGALFGMQPIPVHSCRVLELGCANGGNLIPMAASLPESEFIGIDLSRRQIEDGQGVIESLELENIRLEQRDIVDIDESVGRFDYIVAHGVFSWVTRDVQERILAISRELLSPQGIAYISYNTYPGWHLRGMLRDMMLYHTRQFSDTQTCIDQARALVNFLADAVPDSESPYGRLLSEELACMQNWADSYFFHDSLEVHNEPMYFHQFVDRAARHKLRYLGEAQFSSMLASEFSSEIASTLSEIGRDIVEMEQYMDFVRNRMFRQTLLCREETELDRTLTGSCCEKLHIRSFLQPASVPVDVHSAEDVQFCSPHGTVVTVSAPVQRAALLALSEAFPATISFPALLQQARAMAGLNEFEIHDAQSLETQRNDVRDAVFKCFCDNVMDVQAYPTRLTPRPTERPCASTLARRQAETDGCVTNLLHEPIRLDAVNAHLLKNLDGCHDRADLLKILVELVSNGTIVATRHGEIIEDQETVKTVLAEQLETRLQELARRALLDN